MRWQAIPDRHTMRSARTARVARTPFVLLFAAPALLLGGLALFLTEGLAAQESVAGDAAARWNAEIGVGGFSFQGDQVWAISVGGLRHSTGNESLGVGAHLLLAPESRVCIGLGPCPDGPLRPVAAGAYLEPRFHLGRADGATPAPTWVGPRLALSGRPGRGESTLLELGGAAGHEFRLGSSAALHLTARYGLGLTRNRGETRPGSVVGLSGGLRWVF